MGLPAGTVTFVLTDIEGSTRLFERLGDRYVALLDDHRRLIRTPFGAAGGVEVKSDGDGFVFAFPDARAAFQACAQAQALLQAHPWPPDAQVAVRMGVHTGHAVPIDGDYVSLALHHASRLAAGANGGQVLVSPAAVASAGHTPGVELTLLGTYRLRDITDDWAVHELTGPGVGRCDRAPRLAAAVRHNLPERRTSFVGRSGDVAAVREALAQRRLVTLIGVGGIGKTRLAAEVAYAEAEAFPDGARATQLAPVSDNLAVLTTVAGSLGVDERGDNRLLDAIVEHLAARQVLLLLDCCEHVLEAVSGLVEAVLAACPGVRILATSQVPLGLVDEVVWRVPMLSVPAGERLLTLEAARAHDAVRLFEERSAAARPGWSLQERDLDDVVAICRRLDGIPLALELAAARMAAMDPAQIRRRLVDRFDLLTSQRPAGREATLEMAVDWSYQLLDGAEREVFARLSVFGGSFELADAEAVCGDVLDPLCSLVYRSLVVADDRSGSLRYWMLQTLREFAAARLAEREDASQTQSAYLRWADSVVAGARLSTATLDVLPGGAGAASLDAAHDNLLAALDLALDPGVADVDTALRLAHGLAPYWMLRGWFALAAERIETVLAEADAVVDADRTLVERVRIDAGLTALRRGDLALADCRLAEALDRLAQADAVSTSLALTARALVAWYSHRFDEAHRLLDQAEAVHGAGDDASVTSFRLLTRFKMYNRENRLDEAIAVGEAATVHAARHGLPRHRAAIVQNLAYTHWCRGDLEASRAAAEDALAHFEVHGDPLGVAYCRDNLALVAASAGDLPTAARHLEVALDEFVRIGFSAGVVESLEQAAVLAHDAGVADVAALLLASTSVRRTELGIEVDQPFRHVLDRLPVPDRGHAVPLDQAIDAARCAIRSVQAGPVTHEVAPAS